MHRLGEQMIDPANAKVKSARCRPRDHRLRPSQQAPRTPQSRQNINMMPFAIRMIEVFAMLPGPFDPGDLPFGLVVMSQAAVVQQADHMGGHRVPRLRHA